MDLKTEAINKYIEEHLSTHMSDTSIHFNWDRVSKYVENTLVIAGLTCNTTKILPIRPFGDKNTNIYEIINIIKNTPKNLNGNTLIFAFSLLASDLKGFNINPTNDLTDFILDENTIKDLKILARDFKNPDKPNIWSIYTTGPHTQLAELLTLELNNTFLNFENFYNGTLKIVGNTFFIIDDLNHNLSYYESIQQTNEFNELLTDEFEIKSKTQPASTLVTIKSNGLNGYGTTLRLADLVCNTQLFNLMIENSFTEDDKDTVKLSDGIFIEDTHVCSEIYLDSAEPDVYYNNNLSNALKNNETFLKLNYPSALVNTTYMGLDVLAPEFNINKDNQGIKVLNDAIQRIIYNTSPDVDTTKGASIVVWGKFSEKAYNTTGFTNSMFSDYTNDNINAEKTNGIMFGPARSFYKSIFR